MGLADFSSPRLYIGCAGWSLPPPLRNANLTYLARYAQIFNAVEINSSFYRHHQPKTYAGWAESTPPDFRFSVKVPKAISHEANLELAILGRFRSEVRQLGPKLDTLLLQLPPGRSFDPDWASSVLTALRAEDSQTLVALEPRHETWFRPEAATLAHSFGAAYVYADPPPNLAAEATVKAANATYLRLHGSPRMYYSPYTDEYLEKLAAILVESGVASRWCIFDNTAFGAAVPNALTLKNLVASRMKTRLA